MHTLNDRRRPQRTFQTQWIHPGLIAVGCIPWAVTYYTLIIVYSVNIPTFDDYNTILSYANHSSPQRFSHLFDLHNEHRVAAVRIIAELSNLIIGQIDFRFIALIGNLSLMGILGVLVLERRRFRGFSFYLVILTAVLYTPQPWLNMVWATSAVQSNVVNVFALAAFWGLFDRRVWVALVVPSLCATIATSTSGSGLFVFPILLLAGLTKWFERAAERGCEGIEPKALLRSLTLIAATMFLIGAAYFWGYESPLHTEDVRGDSVLVGIQFLLVLIGAVGGTADVSIGVGVAVLATVSALTMRRAWQQSPVFYWMLIYLLVVALVVAANRSGLGVEYALTSRYRIHSVLVVLFTLASAISTWWPVMGRRSVVALVCCVVLFMYFRDFRNALIALPKSQEHTIAVTARFAATGRGLQYMKKRRKQAAGILIQAIQNGVYKLPTVVHERAEAIRARTANE